MKLIFANVQRLPIMVWYINKALDGGNLFASNKSIMMLCSTSSPKKIICNDLYVYPEEGDIYCSKKCVALAACV